MVATKLALVVGWHFILLILFFACRTTDSALLRPSKRSLQQAHEEPLSSFDVIIGLSMHYVDETAAAAIESASPLDPIVDYFCQSINTQAGGNQVRKAASEHDIVLESRTYESDRMCKIIGTRRMQGTGGEVVGPGYVTLEVVVEQVVYAGLMEHMNTGIIQSAREELSLQEVKSLVDVGFNRGRGGRAAFLQLIQAHEAFANVIDVDVIDVPTNAPTLSPTISPTTNAPSAIPSTTHYPSQRPSVLSAMPTTSKIPSAEPSLLSSGQPSNSPSIVTFATAEPSRLPTEDPTPATAEPSRLPTKDPTLAPTRLPTSWPTILSRPSAYPSVSPSFQPSRVKSATPSNRPVAGIPVIGTEEPSIIPSWRPTSYPDGAAGISANQSPGRADASSRNLPPAAIVSIVAGGLVCLVAIAAMFAYPMYREKYSDQDKQDDDDPSRNYLPQSPSRISRSTGPDHKTTPKRGNVRLALQPPLLLSSVPNQIDLDDDGKSLADTTLGEHTAGRKPALRKKRISDMDVTMDENKSYADESLFTSTDIVPPRNMGPRKVPSFPGVEINHEDELCPTDDEAPDETGPTFVKIDPNTQNKKTLQDIVKEHMPLTEENFGESQRKAILACSVSSSSGDEDINEPSSNASSAGEDNHMEAAFDQIYGIPVADKKPVEVGATNQSPVRVNSMGVRANSEPSLAHFGEHPPTPIKSPPRRRGSMKPNAKPPYLRSASPFRARFLELAGTNKQQHYMAGQAPIDKPSSSMKSKKGPNPATDATKIQDSEETNSVSSSSSSGGGMNPWLYDGNERTIGIGPRSKSADMESTSGRSSGRSIKSGKSAQSLRSRQTSDQSIPSFYDYVRKHRNAVGAAGSNSACGTSSRRSTDSPSGSRRSVGSRSTRDSGVSSSAATHTVSEATRRTYETELARLEHQLAMIHDAETEASVEQSQSPTEDSKSSTMARTSEKKRIIVAVPPGKLGVILANRRDGKGTVITEVRPTSVLQGRLVPGDKLVAIDGQDVTAMIVSDITALMTSKAHNERQLTVITSTKLRESVLTPCTEPLSENESDVSPY